MKSKNILSESQQGHPREFDRGLLNKSDRKYVKGFHVENDGNKRKYLIYLSLITESGLIKIIEFINRINGNIRIYPYENLICVEISASVQ
jgi:hypothetical protein